jgi:hypothetical protein
MSLALAGRRPLDFVARYGELVDVQGQDAGQTLYWQEEMGTFVVVVGKEVNCRKQQVAHPTRQM